MMAYTVPFLFDRLIPMMVGDITGSALLTGALVMMTLFVVGLAMRLTMEMQIIMMFLAVNFLLIYWIPWLLPVVFVGAGLAIGAFLIYSIFMR
jgi:hypothetical protein